MALIVSKIRVLFIFSQTHEQIMRDKEETRFVFGLIDKYEDEVNYHNGFCLRFVYKRGIIFPLGPCHHHHKTHFVFATINFGPDFLYRLHIISFHFPSIDLFLVRI